MRFQIDAVNPRAGSSPAYIEGIFNLGGYDGKIYDIN